jgi:magnesium transporter
MQPFHSISLLVPEIKELLSQKNYTLLKQVLRECNPVEFADCWRQFTEDERLSVFRLLSAASAIKLFEILDIEDQRYLLGKLNEENVTPLLESMPSPELAKLFHKLSPRLVKKMTGLMKRQEALAHVDLLMKFPENSAGSLMHPEFVKLSPKLTAKQALLLLQAIARPNQKEHLFALYVTDEAGRVLGTLMLQDLLSASEDQKLSELMTSVEGIKIKPETDQEEAAKLISRYNLSSAPVVDDSGKLMGILAVKDILSVVRQEATEDIAKMAGTSASDIEERSIFKIVRLRMPWLVVTVFGGLLVSLIIKFFEPTLAKVIALASFSPLIAGMGGNVGSQSATIMVRSLALGNVNGHHRLRVIFRELRVGLILGIVYGTLLGAVAYLIYGSQYDLHFSFVVAVGMCTSMTVAATMGAVGPLFFERIGVDPATATGPLITTTTDIISNFTYFALATLLLLQF